MVARRPCLEDYDRGNAGVYWAEYIAARAHPCYDQYDPNEYSPPARTPNEIKADASVAQARYEAHRERARLAEIEARKYAERARKEAKKRELAKRAEEAERRRAWEASHEQRRIQEAEAQARRARWLQEQREWAERDLVERLSREAAAKARYSELSVGAKSADALGRGNVIRIVNKNVNIGQNIRMEIGEVWDVGAHWCVQLINDGYAVML